MEVVFLFITLFTDEYVSVGLLVVSCGARIHEKVLLCKKLLCIYISLTKWLSVVFMGFSDPPIS